jgi:hypothetical protein
VYFCCCQMPVTAHYRNGTAYEPVTQTRRSPVSAAVVARQACPKYPGTLLLTSQHHPSLFITGHSMAACLLLLLLLLQYPAAWTTQQQLRLRMVQMTCKVEALPKTRCSSQATDAQRVPVQPSHVTNQLVTQCCSKYNQILPVATDNAQQLLLTSCIVRAGLLSSAELKSHASCCCCRAAAAAHETQSVSPRRWQRRSPCLARPVGVS